MRRLVFVALFAVLCTSRAGAQTLIGLAIGDDESAVASLGPSGHSERIGWFTARKWTLANGNDLSVSFDDAGKIVYIELDWGRSSAGAGTGFLGLTFGQSTLGELRERFGYNGMGFKERSPVYPMGERLALFNSWEAGTTIVTFISTVMRRTTPVTVEQMHAISNAAKLDAIALASPIYAAREWGEAVRPEGYKPMGWVQR